ncbi:hypothetical protein L4C34_14025 [Vibrio profundum]|uniref:hypothetical protein n=1 Tax=Vibrio profundum TaxID=2910247 RepID=UPI003D12F036
MSFYPPSIECPNTTMEFAVLLDMEDGSAQQLTQSLPTGMLWLNVDENTYSLNREPIVYPAMQARKNQQIRHL